MPEPADPKLRQPIPPPTSVAPCAFDYAELDVTSNYSFLRGASHPDELVYTAAELGYRAIAITDLHTLAGVVKAHMAARSCKMKLLIGSRIPLIDGPELLVWASDRAAYGRLCRMLTLGKRRVEKGKCHLSVQDFLDHSDGLLAAIASSPCIQGEDRGEGSARTRGSGASTRRTLSPALSLNTGRGSEALDILREALGDRLSLIVSQVYGTDDESHLRHMIDLSRELRIPLVATNAVHYHDPGRRMLQDVLTCVRHGCTIHDAGFKLFANGERYLKSPEQMHRLFRACPSAIRRTIEIADRCSFRLDELRYEYPDELVPAGQTSLQYLTDLTWHGANERYAGNVPRRVRDAIVHELTLIAQLKYEAYFLTVYDLVRFARSRDILCQGRGSAANSTVCYCIGVTSVDPARIDLLFERFISAARNEPPDIDVDFEHERREEVIQYVYQKYGRDRAGMTATLITYRGRSAVRDVGKAMGLSLDTVDSLAKRLDWWHRGTLTNEQLAESGIDGRDATVRAVVALTGELLGFPRHLGQHTGGMIMSRGLLSEMVPIENASMEDRTVVEWDKDDVEELGLLKVDILALGMLTCISKAFALLAPSPRTRGEGGGEGSADARDVSELGTSPHLNLLPECREKGRREKFQLHTIPPEDPRVYDMICDADTVGVFQIESRAQMSMLPRLRPRCFYDIVIEVAIVRPGPIQGNMVHPYLRRRNGEEPVTFPSDALRGVLGKTLGVPLFQEQAMKVVMVAASFSAEEADQLRRAMAAWRRSGAIRGFHQKILEGMAKNGYTPEFAERTFEQIQGFGEYGFPESHSASFALLVYASCWLKRYHPAAFCCALLNSQPMGFYAPAQIVRDAREHGVEVRCADVNASEWDGLLEIANHKTQITNELQNQNSNGQKSSWGADGPAVRLGFRQIKGFREDDATRIAVARREVGRFETVEQLQRATGLPKNVLERLAEADAFGSLGLTRREALWHIMELTDAQLPLFNESIPSPRRSVAPSLLPTMPLGQEVMIDYATTHLSLKKHPVALVRDSLVSQRILTARDVNMTIAGTWVKVAGLVLIRQRPGTASGIVFITLEDETGIVNLIVRPNIYDRYKAAARHAALLQCDGYVERKGQVVHVMAKRMFDRSDMIRGYELSSRDFH